MRFVVVKPKDRWWQVVDCEELKDAERLAGLGEVGVDHGPIVPRMLYVVVYEFGLYEERESFWKISDMMMAGPGVLYQVGERGETVDIEDRWVEVMRRGLRWGDAKEMERLIGVGAVQRPEMRVNGELVWQWPGARPDLEGISRKLVHDGAKVVRIGDIDIVRG